MTVVLVLGLAMNAVALPLAARRVLFLFRVITSGQPAPDRIAGVTGRAGAALKRQVVEVLGQKKLLKWSVPGAAHFFVFWAFLILATVYLEAYGSLLKLLFGGRQLDWAIPVVGHWAILGFLQDFIAMMAFFGIATFVWIRLKNAPKDLGRKSRFFGSHLSGAWITLFMIFNVIWTMYLFRGASSSVDNLPYRSGAFISIGVGNVLGGLPHGGRELLEGIGLLLHIGVMLVFLIFVLNSKHLHIFVAPLNVLFGRQPVALGAAKPMMNAGKPLTLDDLDDLDEDAKLGVGAAEDFSWKGILDFTTCTECGRCQDQCPAWNTEKPLSPKLMIMALRDHTLAKAPYLLADESKREALVGGDEALAREVQRPLVGETGEDWFYMPESGAGVIDPDVLWSCVTCGACVQQCPVDIEHVDHIIDMRRYQVLVESNFPAELNQLFKGMENKGNPWNMSPSARLDWTKGLEFDVPVVGQDLESLESVDWLFWVGCAGAYEDRAKKTTRAVAELLSLAGVSFGVLGQGETCTGDSARRAGNEFVFQGLAQQNVETFKEFKVKKVVSTCAHCFNTLKNEYRDFGIELEVVHHTQLLNRLVREGKLTPVNDGAGAAKRSITYHDPCYLGRHNQVYAPPRELLQVLPGAEFVEMERNSERSFCCGAGGARMWMEETIGSRINENRTAEAVATGADQIAVGCPFCRVMLSDGLTSKQASGEAREEVEVLDVAQMLLASIKGESATKLQPGGAPTARSEETRAEPEAGDDTQTDDTVTATEDVGAAAAAAAGSSSLFDESDANADVAETPDETPDQTQQDETPAKAASGGSLFDLDLDLDSDADADSDDAEAEAETEEQAQPESEPEPAPAEDATASEGSTKEDLGSSGSLFDLGAQGEEPAEKPDAEPAAATSEPEPRTEAAVESEPTATADEIPEGGSLFDLAAPEAPAEAAATEESEPTEEPAAQADPESPEAESPEPAPDAEPEVGADTSEPAPTAAAPSAEIPESGSLFDIEAPQTSAEQSSSAPEPEPESKSAAETPESRTEAQAEGAPAEDPSDSDRTSGADLSRLATEAASDEDDQAEQAERQTDPTEEPEAVKQEPAEPTGTEDPPPTDPPAAPDAEGTDGTHGTDDGTAPETKDAPSGPGHAPRTDIDISESGSLFDL